MFDSYSFGCITFNHTQYRYDIFITLQGVARERPQRRSNHLLEASELRQYLEPGTKKLVVGTGESGVMDVADDARELLKARGIILIEAPSGEAIHAYNREKDKSVVMAVIHSTC